MKRIALQVLAASALAASLAVFAAERPVQVYVEGLPPHIAKEVVKSAAEGETALKQYLERTKNLHRLSYEDVTQPRPRPVSAEDPGMQKEVKKHANDYR